MKTNSDTVAWNVTHTVSELQRLLAHGVIGLYRSFEVTEILGFQRDQPPTNFLTLAVAEPTEPPVGESPKPLFLNNKKRLVLTGTDWTVGVARYRIPLEALVGVLSDFSQTGQWKPGPAPLKVGTLVAVTPQFVPASWLPEHPWNRVLKNNFWEGSHVLELFDTSKQYVQFLLQDSRILTKLAKLIRPHVDMGIDGLSDRLGNVLIQLPVTVISTGVRGSVDSDHAVAVAWHPDVPPRPLRVSAEIYEDATVEAFDSATVTTGVAPLNLHSPSGGSRICIWDDPHRVLLGATPVTGFITSVAMSTHVVGNDYEPAVRRFLLPAGDGPMEPQSVFLQLEEKPVIVGRAHRRPSEPWQQNRIFSQSLAALQERKEFVQYGGITGAGRTKALDDIRWLMSQHGKQGVWLWDPYLCADDVLRTLFFCPRRGAELRALTAGLHKSPPDQEAALLEAAKGNCLGLALEFRIRKGMAGWSFHDRFIIFPAKDGPAIAWSLGTSVSGLGQQHHILQKVSNGELIANAFRDLWDKLDKAEHLIWKSS